MKLNPDKTKVLLASRAMIQELDCQSVLGMFVLFFGGGQAHSLEMIVDLALNFQMMSPSFDLLVIAVAQGVCFNLGKFNLGNLSVHW